MQQSTFYQFKNSIPIAKAKPFNGLLSFLPQAGTAPPHVPYFPRHVAFAHGDMQWLEIKASDLSQPVELTLIADTPCFWLIFQLEGTSKLYLPAAVPIPKSFCHGVGSRRERIPLTLDPGNCWMLIIVCKAPLLPGLSQEFDELKELGTLHEDSELKDYTLINQPIDYVLRRRFQTLEKMEYKAFSTPIFLQEWHFHTLHHLFRTAPYAAQGQLSLYHSALQYIREHFLEELDKFSVASALNVSSRSLNRAFENKPIKIADYIHTLKLQKAQELLFEQKLSIEEISRELNFSCPKYFSKSYKQYYLESPSDFRLQYVSKQKGKPAPEEN